jgi:hypothetical protein
MPELYDYLAAYGLAEGTIIAGYQLHLINPEEHTVRRWKEYSYSGELDFMPLANADRNALYAHMHMLTGQRKVVYGTRDPYDCTFGISNIYYDDSNGLVRMILDGHAVK